MPLVFVCSAHLEKKSRHTIASGAIGPLGSRYQPHPSVLASARVESQVGQLHPSSLLLRSPAYWAGCYLNKARTRRRTASRPSRVSFSCSSFLPRPLLYQRQTNGCMHRAHLMQPAFAVSHRSAVFRRDVTEDPQKTPSAPVMCSRGKTAVTAARDGASRAALQRKRLGYQSPSRGDSLYQGYPWAAIRSLERHSHAEPRGRPSAMH